MRSTVQTLCLLILFSTSAFGQVLIGTVVDSEYNELPGAIVRDTVHESFSITDERGNFLLSVKNNSLLKVSYIGYEDHFMKIDKTEKSDTIREFIQLTPDEKFLSTVTVSAERIKAVYDENSVNVLDYIPYENFILVLKKYKSDYLLSVEYLSSTLSEFKLNRMKDPSFFEDCFGNIHLTTRDSAYQIWIDTSLHLFGGATMQEFNKLVKPCVGNYSNTTFFKGFRHHQKHFILSKLDKNTLNKSIIFEVYDKQAAKIAIRDYNSIISYYNYQASETSNIIENGFWDGNLIALADNPKLNHMITWYTKISGKPINVETFSTNNHFIVFDHFQDSIHLFDENGLRLKSVKYPHRCGNKKHAVLMDKHRNKFYTLCDEKGLYKVIEIDIFTGISKESTEVERVSIATNIQIFNNWVYFRKAENGFHKLYRVKVNN